MIKREWKLSGLGAVALAVALCAAGVVTNGVPQVTPGYNYAASDGVVGASGATGSNYWSQLGGYELVPADTQLGSGAAPQSVAPSVFQLGAFGAALAANTAGTCNVSSNTCTVTYNHELGVTTLSAGITTAAGAQFVATITDSAITAASKVQAAVYNVTNTTGPVQLVSVVPGSGSVVITFQNNGSSALNGTLAIAWQAN